MSQYSSRESTAIGCKCGVTLSIDYVKQPGHNDREEFDCPVCGETHSIMASLSINSRNFKLDSDAFKTENRMAINNLITAYKFEIEAIAIELGGLDSRHESLDEAEIRHAQNLQNQTAELEAKIANLTSLLADFR